MVKPLCFGNDENIIFSIKGSNLYAHVNLSARDNEKLTKFLKRLFERSVYWNG